MSSQPSKSLNGGSNSDQNLACGVRVALIVAAAAALAIMLDLSTFPTLFSSMLLIAAITRGIAAARAQEPILGQSLNRWDETVMLLGFGLGINLIASLATG